MHFLILLRQYWIVIAFAACFSAGYYLKGLQVKAGQQKDIIKVINHNNTAASAFEDARRKIESEFENVDLKVTYEDSYSCPIPPDGLQLLLDATR